MDDFRLPPNFLAGKLFAEGVKPSIKEEKNTQEKIKIGLGKFADAVHRFGIVLTGILPCSARGILVQLIIMPILIPFGLIKSIGPNFSENMKEYVSNVWNQGIEDVYTDLEGVENKDLREAVIKENFRYAAYMYANADVRRKEGGEHGVLLSRSGIDRSAISVEHLEVIRNIEIKLKDELGFEVDPFGNYYHQETGNLFNLVFDKERNEVIVGFMGLGNQNKLIDVSDEVKEKIGNAAVNTVLADFLGGIPDASLQAIEIGKILKTITDKTGITPVIIGHSHGGGLAQTAACANGIKGIIFNSRPMGANVRRYIGQAKIAENENKMVAFSVKGDWVSGNRALNFLAAAFERITGYVLPRNVGKGYHLPNMPEEDSDYHHNSFHEAFLDLKDMN